MHSILLDYRASGIHYLERKHRSTQNGWNRQYDAVGSERQESQKLVFDFVSTPPSYVATEQPFKMPKGQGANSVYKSLIKISIAKTGYWEERLQWWEGMHSKLLEMLASVFFLCTVCVAQSQDTHPPPCILTVPVEGK